MAKRLNQCQSWKDFMGVAEKSEAIIKEGKSHTKVIVPGKGMTTIPRHKKIAPGTIRSIVKAFMRLGIAAFIFAVFVQFLGG